MVKKQVSYYWETPWRIFGIFLIILFVGFVIILTPIYSILFNEELNFFSAFILIFFTGAPLFCIYMFIKSCDVESDNKYLYVSNLLTKDIIPVENIHNCYYQNIVGFVIVFKTRTKFGKSISFYQIPFYIKETSKYLSSLIASKN